MLAPCADDYKFFSAEMLQVIPTKPIYLLWTAPPKDYIFNCFLSPSESESLLVLDSKFIVLCSSVFNHEHQKSEDPLNSKDISDSAFFSLKHKAYLDIEWVFVPVIADMINITLPQNKGRAAQVRCKF